MRAKNSNPLADLSFETEPEKEALPNLSRSYESRGYMKDIETGKTLHTTVMYDKEERIEGTGRVIERLCRRIPETAKQLGGKNLRTRDFIDAFRIRGPDYGDVVRIAVDRLVVQGKMLKRNIGVGGRHRYRYDLAQSAH